MNKALEHLGKHAHHLVSVWPQETGVAYRDDEMTGKRTYIAYGVKGGADISGIAAFSGRRVECEAKSGTATQQDNQKRFENMILSRGGIYIVFRTPEGLLELLMRALSK